jgi:hypothetical protein
VQSDRLEADVRLAHVVPLIAVHGLGSQTVEACAARAKELGDRLADWPGRFAAHRVVWHTCLLRQPVPRAVGLARDLFAFAERSGDPANIAIACRALGYSLFIAGEQAEADPVLAQGVTLADGLADSKFAVYGENPRIICRISIAAMYGASWAIRRWGCGSLEKGSRGHVPATIRM